jgi:hypothetical protein
MKVRKKHQMKMFLMFFAPGWKYLMMLLRTKAKTINTMKLKKESVMAEFQNTPVSCRKIA